MLRWARRRRRLRACRSGLARRRRAAVVRRRARTGGASAGRRGSAWRPRSSSHAGSTSRPARSAGRVMFSSAVSVGSRLNDWKTNPRRSRRRMVRSRSESEARSVAPMSTWPDVRVSRPARQCIRVDLPEPEGPMMAVNWPGGRSRRQVVEGGHHGVAGAVDLAGVSSACRQGADESCRLLRRHGGRRGRSGSLRCHASSLGGSDGGAKGPRTRRGGTYGSCVPGSGVSGASVPGQDGVVTRHHAGSPKLSGWSTASSRRSPGSTR